MTGHVLRRGAAQRNGPEAAQQVATLRGAAEERSASLLGSGAAHLSAAEAAQRTAAFESSGEASLMAVRAPVRENATVSAPSCATHRKELGVGDVSG